MCEDDNGEGGGGEGRLHHRGSRLGTVAEGVAKAGKSHELM